MKTVNIYITPLSQIVAASQYFLIADGIKQRNKTNVHVVHVTVDLCACA